MPKDRRLAGLHRNLVEQHFNAELGENILYKIVLAHRNAPGNQEDVVIETLPDLRAQIFEVVFRDTQLVRRGSGFAQLNVNGVAVAVPYLAWSRELLDIHQFIAR